MIKVKQAKHVEPSMVARWLDVHEVTVREWIRSGRLPALNVGSDGTGTRYRIFRKDLVAFLVARGLTEERAQDLLQPLA